MGVAFRVRQPTPEMLRTTNAQQRFRFYMYLAYYNLSAKPFQINTDPRFLWLGNDHKEALAHFKYGLLESNGYVVLIGDVGTGKTTLVNALLRMLDERVLVADINYPSLDPVEFLSFTVRAYDPTAAVAGKADCLHFLKKFLLRAHAEGKTVLLVIDEAHQLSETLLEEIRLLSNMETDGEKLLNIFFVGQTELKRKLQSSHALRQRITLFYHLQPLSENDTLQYIAHRLRMAGTQAQLFTDQAVHAVYRYSQGYPRLINKLCDRALLTGYVKERPTVDAPTVLECAREISLIDPIVSLIPVARRLPRPVRTPLDRTRRHRTLSAVKRNFTAGLNHLRTTAAARMRPGAGSKTERQTPAPTDIEGRFFKQHRRKIALAASAALILVIAGWMVTGRWEHLRSARLQLADKTRPTVQKTQMPTAAPAAPEQPPDAGAPPADRPTPPATAIGSSPAENPSPLPETAAAPPPSPAVPEPTQIAAALLAKSDYQSVLAMFESRDASLQADNADAARLYARALVGRADQLMGRSPQQAQALLRKAVAADSRNVEALVQLGNLYTRDKAYAEAIAAYRKAVGLDPQRSDALFNLGFILANTGMYESAEEMLVRVVRLKPDYVDKALFNLAVVQQKIGKREESLASLEAAVAIRPENQKARAYLEELKSTEQETR